MVFAVQRRGETVGTVEVTEEPRGYTFLVDCVGGTLDIVRCYGKTEREPLLLGVLEPQEGRLRCKRTITRQSLAAHGGSVPQTYYLYGGPADMPASTAASIEPQKQKPVEAAHVWTLDPAIDAALQSGGAVAEEMVYGLRLKCVFDPQKPFALAFAAGICHLEQKDGKNFAVINFQRPFYRTGDLLE